MLRPLQTASISVLCCSTMLTAGVGWANGFITSSTCDLKKLHERTGIQSQAVAAVVTMDTDMETVQCARAYSKMLK